ncbi:hypothetical protein GCM10022254_75700 [Actinomadura meridiana]|uniref:Uncharacterized protein n=1 Tax=Actinomadura meridiana TaxID=559626 RepID=A0ABP8CRK7_9ACTN
MLSVNLHQRTISQHNLSTKQVVSSQPHPPTKRPIPTTNGQPNNPNSTHSSGSRDEPERLRRRKHIISRSPTPHVSTTPLSINPNVPHTAQIQRQPTVPNRTPNPVVPTTPNRQRQPVLTRHPHPRLDVPRTPTPHHNRGPMLDGPVPHRSRSLILSTLGNHPLSRNPPTQLSNGLPYSHALCRHDCHPPVAK